MLLSLQPKIRIVKNNYLTIRMIVLDSLGLLVSYRYTEVIRQWLKTRDLIELSLSFIHRRGAIVIPIKVTKLQTILSLIHSMPFNVQVAVVFEDFPSKSHKHPNLQNALRNVLPSDLVRYIPRSFDIIGSIVIINIPEELIEYKELIGKKIIQLFSSVKTVYRKMSAVSGELRVRELELIAGEKHCITIHKEYNVQLYVDVCNAYFSPRLSNEHDRVANFVKSDEVVIDLFTGVGPFPIHIAKRCEASIIAIDLNPIAIKCLNESIKMNRLSGRIKAIVGDCKKLKDELPKADRIIMNLPGKAYEFFDVVTKISKDGTIIHFYAFVSSKNGKKELRDIAEKKLAEYGWVIKQELQFVKIRETAPYEIHACLDLVVSPSNI